MKISNRAKKKWFKENINSFEIFYYDAMFNTRLVWYNKWNSYIEHDKDELYCDEMQDFVRYIDKMSMWEIFFKCRHLKGKNLYDKDIFIMDYYRYNKKNIEKLLGVK